MIEGVKNMAELTRDIVKGCNIVKKEDQTDEKYLFTKETGGKYRLKEDYDKIAEENIFGDKEFNLKDELKGVQKIDFNKVKFIYENAFQLVKFEGVDLNIQFDPEKKEVEIGPGAFGENFKVKKIIGKDDTNILLYKSSFANFSDIEFEKINLYLRGEGWTKADIDNLRSKDGIKELFNRNYENLKEKSEKSNQQQATEQKIDKKDKAETEPIVPSAWEELEVHRQKNIIKSIVETLRSGEFTIVANIDISKVKIRNNKLVLKGKDCFDGDIKLVSADTSLVDILKSICEKNNLKNDPKNRNSAKKATKEYIKNNWERVTENNGNNSKIETSIRVTKGYIDDKKQQFLNNHKEIKQSIVSISDVSDISDQLKELEEKGNGVDDKKIKSIMKQMYIVGKGYKKRNIGISRNCKNVIMYIKKNCMGKDVASDKFKKAQELWKEVCEKTNQGKSSAKTENKGSSSRALLAAMKDAESTKKISKTDSARQAEGQELNTNNNDILTRLSNVIKECKKIYSNYEKSYVSTKIFASEEPIVKIFKNGSILALIFGDFGEKDSMHNVTKRVKSEINEQIISSFERSLGDFKERKFEFILEENGKNKEELYQILRGLKEAGEIDRYLEKKLKKYLKPR